MPIPLTQLDPRTLGGELYGLLERGVPIPPMVINYGTMYVGSGNVGNLTYNYSYQVINQSQPELAQLLVELSGYPKLKETVDELANCIAEANSSAIEPKESKKIIQKTADLMKNVSTIIGTAKELAPQGQELFYRLQSLVSCFLNAHGIG